MIEQEINNILNNSIIITGYVGTNIYNHHLPDNYDIQKNAIVFIINKDESVDTLDSKNDLEMYSLEIITVGGDTIIITSITNAIEELLVNYNDNYVRDINTISISPTLDAEKDRYIKRITFNIIYNK